MDIELFQLTNLRIDVIFAIVGIVETVKTVIENRQLSIYIILTLVLSFIFGWTLASSAQELVFSGLVYFGVGSFFYKAVLRIATKYANKMEQQSFSSEEV